MKLWLSALLLVVAVAAQNEPFPPGLEEWHWKPRHPLMPGVGEPSEQYPDTFIVGGTEAGVGKRPFQAAVIIDNAFFCGGFLIDPEWVVTAGHCVFQAQQMVVGLGVYNITADKEDGRQVFLTQAIFLHENFSYPNLPNDIALVKLPTKANITDTVKTIALPTKNDADIGVGVNLTASGWGKISDDSPTIAPVLRVVTVPSISNDDCAVVYGKVVVTNNTLCTSSKGGAGTCNGDSGGPLTVETADGTVTVRAIVSFGHVEGCQSGYPDGFTRVGHFLDWIADTMSKN